mmetsp:Transcript_34644/g.78171  ORF Transcript_34644/g.78171 Transcript_34644/m.78171 type:complete len:321 (-) Transcript_34644:40-1002(-)
MLETVSAEILSVKLRSALQLRSLPLRCLEISDEVILKLAAFLLLLSFQRKVLHPQRICHVIVVLIDMVCRHHRHPDACPVPEQHHLAVMHSIARRRRLIALNGGGGRAASGAREGIHQHNLGDGGEERDFGEQPTLLDHVVGQDGPFYVALHDITETESMFVPSPLDPFGVEQPEPSPICGKLPAPPRPPGSCGERTSKLLLLQLPRKPRVFLGGWNVLCCALRSLGFHTDRSSLLPPPLRPLQVLLVRVQHDHYLLLLPRTRRLHARRMGEALEVQGVLAGAAGAVSEGGDGITHGEDEDEEEKPAPLPPRRMPAPAHG